MMTTKTQTPANPLVEIAERIREMREIIGYSPAQMAERTEVTEELYRSYETGTVDLPFTFLHKCAVAFGMELTDLLEGQSAKLSSYTVTRRGEGLTTAEEDGVIIQNLAPMFRKKLAAPYWVTYQYSADLQNKPIHTTTHAGQEFDLVLKGTLKVRVGDHEELLHEGDTIFYRSSIPHGMIAMDGQDCLFLAVVMADTKPEKADYILPRKPSEQENGFVCDPFVRADVDENGTPTALHFSNTDRFNFAFDIVDELGRTAARQARDAAHLERHDRAPLHLPRHEGALRAGRELLHLARHPRGATA
jgi:acetyl-CoA synthetase